MNIFGKKKSAYQSKKSTYTKIQEARGKVTKEKILSGLESYASKVEAKRIAKAKTAKLQKERLSKIKLQLFGKQTKRKRLTGRSLFGLTKAPRRHKKSRR